MRKNAEEAAWKYDRNIRSKGHFDKGQEVYNKSPLRKREQLIRDHRRDLFGKRRR
jgi:hypothetical protein